MSTAVKAFLVVILILSLATAYFAMDNYATQENWKRRWDMDTKELKKDLESSNQTLANESKAKVKAEAGIVTREALITDLQASIKRLEDDKTQLNQEIATLRLNVKKKETDFNALTENFMAQSKSLEMVRTRNAELTHITQVARAVAFNLNVKLSEVEDDLNNAQAALTQRAQDLDGLTKDLKKHQAMVSLLRDRHPVVYNELVDQKASGTYLSAVVAAVRNSPEGKQDLIMLTIGKEDKVEEGVEFIIFRGSDYVVKARAERILDGMVACRVIADTWNTKNLSVQQGDSATNRL
jgi:septal ring factor EnvC (AmiA/AmiB activator)